MPTLSPSFLNITVCTWTSVDLGQTVYVACNG
ncbi:hypothetical protein [Hadaka virus 1]|nr:hypothetical protein [Hadaka virus 1]